MLAAPSARAGSYVDTQTGAHGTPVVTPAADCTYSAPEDAIATSSVSPYSPDGDPTYIIQINPGGVPVVDTFSWVPDSNLTLTTDPPPSCAIVEQISRTLWYVRNEGGTGSGSGLNDCGLPGALPLALTYQGNGPTDGRIATLYSVQSSSMASFAKVCNPTVTFTGVTGSDGYVEGEALVQASASASPVTITFDGVSKDSSGNYNILGSQGCTASLSGIPTECTVSNYTWSVSGATFQSWNPTFIGGPGPLTNPTAHWYWNDPSQTIETVTCTATVTPPGGDGAPFPVTVTQLVTVVPQIHITSTNPSNPTPIVLTTTTALPIPVSGTLIGLPNTFTTVTATLYSSAQIPVVTLPAQSVALDANGNGTASFTWDGIESDGTAAPPGEYLFKFSVTDSNGNVIDTDKSSFLSISTPDTDAELFSDDGTTAQFTVRYILSSTDAPARPASVGEIDVYDPNQVKIITQTLGTGDLTPGLHTVTVTMPSMQLEGNYVFLTSAQDSDADNDVAHRQRWALQHNVRYNNGEITLITSGKYHIAWCRAKHPVQLRTLLPLSGLPEKHAPRNWVNATPVGETRAAVNGNFYGPETLTPPVTRKHPEGDLSQVTIFGEIGLNGNWKTYTPCPKLRACFGMKSTLTDLSSFGSFGMQSAIDHHGHIIPKQYVVADGIKAFPYGFSDVGFLVNQQASQPVPTDLKGKADWPNPTDDSHDSGVARTAIAWSSNGDFFLITSSGSSWNAMAAWCVSPTGFFATNPELASLYAHSNLRMQTAMMLDGGSSPEFGYFDNYTPPKTPVKDDKGQISSGYYLPNLLGVYYP
jgi:hypothetical protein